MRHSTNKEYQKLFYTLLNKYSSGDDKQRCFHVYKEMVELFFERHKRYPTATEFTNENLLPTARMLQRNYGGITKFRKDIGLAVTNYTKGEARQEKMKKILGRAKDYEFELFLKLFKKLHRPNEGIFVQQEPVISFYEPTKETYGYRKADVAINDFSGNKTCKTTYIDFFYASNAHSFYGCVNLKVKKVLGLVNIEDIMFVSVNPDITKDMVSKMTLPKKSPRVLSYEEFIKEFDLA